MSIYYTGRSVDATRNQVRLQEQGQITDRFARAVEQLGSDQVNVRLGGIYSLERLMHDSPQDRSTIAQVLCGFVRERAKNRRPPFGHESAAEWPRPDQGNRATWPKPATDVQAAVTVLGRRPLPDTRAKEPLDLSDTDLSSADLSRGNFAFANFQRSSLVGATFLHANLTGSIFYSTDLAQSNISAAKAVGAKFTDCRLDDAWLNETDLTQAALWVHADGANSRGADLTGASLNGASLMGAEFKDTNLLRVDLVGADLRKVKLADARNFAPLACMNIDGETTLPAGITRPPRCEPL
ncbi:pentapeptide repeat-containing protein [Micromonospora sp. NPDC048843]|uniref:pentapeptide repeat-containing protein n=1 Tax=Micromonospora sp. NPDC048843 TaxID=3155389 RepID=UPI00340D5F4A